MIWRNNKSFSIYRIIIIIMKTQKEIRNKINELVTELELCYVLRDSAEERLETDEVLWEDDLEDEYNDLCRSIDEVERQIELLEWIIN